MQRWEYKTIKLETSGFCGGILDIAAFDQLLNHWGYQGWELVEGFTTNMNYGESREVIAVLKRPLNLPNSAQPQQ